MNSFESKQDMMSRTSTFDRPTIPDISTSRCDSLSVSHLLSLQTSLLDDLYYHKRLVRRLQAYIDTLEDQLDQAKTSLPNPPKNRSIQGRSGPRAPQRHRRVDRAAKDRRQPHNLDADKIDRRQKGKKERNRKMPPASHPHPSSSHRQWRKISTPPHPSTSEKATPPPPPLHPNPFAPLAHPDGEDLHKAKVRTPDSPVQVQVSQPEDQDEEVKTSSEWSFRPPSKRSMEALYISQITYQVPVPKCSTRMIRANSSFQPGLLEREDDEEKGVPNELKHPDLDSFQQDYADTRSIADIRESLVT